jgi:hypothetical protein
VSTTGADERGQRYHENFSNQYGRNSIGFVDPAEAGFGSLTVSCSVRLGTAGLCQAKHWLIPPKNVEQGANLFRFRVAGCQDRLAT